MKTNVPRILAISLLCCTVMAAADAQLTVDATAPIRKLRWDTQGFSRGGIFARIPLSVMLERTGDTEAGSGPIKVAFIVTNTGKDDFQVPISPQPAELEPDNPNAEYTVITLHLYVSEVNPHAALRNGAIVYEGPPVLSGGAILYGKPDAPGTMLNLHPGQSIRVLAVVSFPVANTGEPPVKFEASVAKGQDTYSKRGGRRVSDSQDLGSGLSYDFTLSALPSTPMTGALPR